MAYDMNGDRAPDGIGTFASAELGRAAGMEQAYWLQGRSEAEATDDTLSALCLRIVLGIAAFVATIEWLASKLGLSFDATVWLIIVFIAVASIVTTIVKRRVAAAKLDREEQRDLLALGFPSRAAYDAACAERVKRLGQAQYDELVTAVDDINLQATGRTLLASLVEVEQAVTWVGAQRGIDAALLPGSIATGLSMGEQPAGQPATTITIATMSLRDAVTSMVRSAASAIVSKSLLGAALMGISCFALMHKIGATTDGLVAIFIVVPLVLLWSGVGGFLGFAMGCTATLIDALDTLCRVASRVGAQALNRVVTSLGSTPAGVQLSAVPELLARWKAAMLPPQAARGLLFRAGRVVANQLVRRIERQLRKRLEQKSKISTVQHLSHADLGQTFADAVTSSFTGALRTQLSVVRALASGALWTLVVTTLLIAMVVH